MSGITGAMDIGKLALYAAQQALEVTSHNVSNANTEGYSKQNLRVQSNVPITALPGQIGTGVRATEITRQYDDFLSAQVNLKNSDYYYWSTQSTAMQEIESIFNEGDEVGLNAMLGAFWNAWSDLANNPDSTPERDALVATSENLVQAIKDIDYNLRAYQRYLNADIQGGVGQVNSLLTKIADLNAQITSVEIEGQVNANDLRDSRDQMLKELSQYVDISYYEEAQSGQVMVYIMGGTPLVMGTEAYSLTTERNADTGNTDVLWQDSAGREVNITGKLKGGQLAGWISARDSHIGDYLDSLNTMTNELIWQVNSLHAEGTGLSSVSSMTGTETIPPYGSAATLATPMNAKDADGNYYYTFGDRLQAGTFDIVVYDASGNAVDNAVTLGANASVQDLLDGINGIAHMSASVNSDGHLQIDAASGYTFTIKSSDTGQSNHALAILGVNTFFTWSAKDGDLTETINVNQTVQDDTDLIAAGSVDSANKIAVGDNTTATAIFGVQDKVIDMDGSNTTIDAYYSSMVSQVGVHSQNAQTNEKYYITLLGDYTSRKESKTGVNLDEEMANLLKFQRAFQAASKLITTSDEMLQTLLSMKQ